MAVRARRGPGRADRPGDQPPRGGGPCRRRWRRCSFLLPAYGSLTPRPQLISFALLSVVLAAWLQTERDLRPRWWLVPLTFVWSLCHGFWFIGAAYGLLFVVGIAPQPPGRPPDARPAGGRPGRLVPRGPAEPARAGGARGTVRGAAPSPATSPSGSAPRCSPPGPLGALLMVGLTAVLWAVTRTGVSWARVLVLLSAVFWVWYAERLVTVGAVVVVPLLAGALDALLARSRADEPAVATAGRAGERGPAERAGSSPASGRSSLVALAVVVPHTSSEPGRVPLALDAAPRPAAGRHTGLQRLRDGRLDRLASSGPEPVHRRPRHAVLRRALRGLPPGRDGLARVVRGGQPVRAHRRAGAVGRAARGRAATTRVGDRGHGRRLRPAPTARQARPGRRRRRGRAAPWSRRGSRTTRGRRPRAHR